MQTDTTSAVNTITMPQSWAARAHELFTGWFQNLDIEVPDIDPGLWHAAYVIAFGADEIAKHHGTHVQMRFVETEEEFFPDFQCTDQAAYRDIHAMYAACKEDWGPVSKDILSGLRHPVPGTSTPDHRVRSSALERAIHPMEIPRGGAPGSMAFLRDFMKRHEEGETTRQEVAMYERCYGPVAELLEPSPKDTAPVDPRYDPGLPLDELDLEDVLRDDDDFEIAVDATAALAEVSEMLKERPIIA